MRFTAKQYVDMMRYRGGTRPMFSELFGPLIGLDKQWREQGATEEQIKMRAFAFDYVDYVHVGNYEAIDTYPVEVIEDNADYYIERDGFGRTMRMAKATSTIPLPMNYPVEDADDWLKIKHMFRFDESRIDEKSIAEAKERQKNGTLVKTEIYGGFDILRELMGEVNCCIAFYEDPDLIFDILNTISDTNQKLLKGLYSRIHIDQLSIHEDMAGKTAPLIGPDTVREFLLPYYKASWEIAADSGTELFCQDSDGNMNPLIDTFIEGGVNVFYPCEPGGDMDIVRLREKYGHAISFRGGIDKHVLRRTKEEIKAEVDYKMQPKMTSEGGTVFGLDHRIPDGTPLDNYIYYLRLAREKLGLPPFEEDEPGWGRMAF